MVTSKDGRHTIQSAEVENPMTNANLMALAFYRTGVKGDQSYTLPE